MKRVVSVLSVLTLTLGLTFYSYAASVTLNSKGIISNAGEDGTPNTADDIVFDSADLVAINNYIATAESNIASGKSSIASAINTASAPGASSLNANATWAQLSTGIGQIKQKATSDANAVAGNILTGKTAYVNGTKLTGSMANYSSNVQTVTANGNTGTQTYDIADGFHTNIKVNQTATYNAGVTATKKGNAVQGNVLSGKTFTSASGVNLTGSMPNRGNVTDAVLQGASFPAGYYSGWNFTRTNVANATSVGWCSSNGTEYAHVHFPSAYYYPAGTTWGPEIRMTKDQLRSVAQAAGVLDENVAHSAGYLNVKSGSFTPTAVNDDKCTVTITGVTYKPVYFTLSAISFAGRDADFDYAGAFPNIVTEFPIADDKMSGQLASRYSYHHVRLVAPYDGGMVTADEIVDWSYNATAKTLTLNIETKRNGYGCPYYWAAEWPYVILY